MKKTLNLLLSAILVVTSFVGLGNVATADGHGFPSKPIEVVTHAGLGGGTDTTARMLLIRTRKNLKNNAYITPKKGDSGNKAMAYVKSKPRDGHTVLAITPTHLFRMARGEAALTIDDFVGVARVAIAHPNWAQGLSDTNYEPKRPPFTRDELLTADLSPVFVDYMCNWKGFVV